MRIQCAVIALVVTLMAQSFMASASPSPVQGSGYTVLKGRLDRQFMLIRNLQRQMLCYRKAVPVNLSGNQAAQSDPENPSVYLVAYDRMCVEGHYYVQP